MTYAYGSVVVLTTTVRNAAGALADPVSISVIVMRPDGTVTSSAPGVQVSAGAYSYDFVPTQAGRHIARWVSVNPSGASEEPFDVAAQWGDAGIVSLTAAKNHLNIPLTNTAVDEELAGFILATTEIVERFVGSVTRRTVVDSLDGGGPAVALSQPPVLAITSVTASGGTVDPSGYHLHAASGVLHRRIGYEPASWLPGIGNVVVTYTAGRQVITENINRGALMIIAHLWETQRSSSGRRPQVGETLVSTSGTHYSIPNRAVELLGGSPLGIA